VLHAALVTYFKLLSRAAHAWGTPEWTALLPGIIAQPPFSTYAACCHESVFFNAVRLSVASALRWNCSTQIGATAATTALLAVLSANVFRVRDLLETTHWMQTTARRTSVLHDDFRDALLPLATASRGGAAAVGMFLRLRAA